MDPSVRDTLLLSARTSREMRAINPSPASRAGMLLEQMSVGAALLHAKAQLEYLTAVVAEDEGDAMRAGSMAAQARSTVPPILLGDAAQ